MPSSLWEFRAYQLSARSSIAIRRDGKTVYIGIFRDMGFKYLWTHYVKVEIDETGAWCEVFAMKGSAWSESQQGGIDWDSFEFMDIHDLNDDDLFDPNYALGAGRDLGRALFEAEVWRHNIVKANSEFVIDGKRMIFSINGIRQKPKMALNRISEGTIFPTPWKHLFIAMDDTPLGYGILGLPKSLRSAEET